jgi:hypothetical protein
MTSFMKTMRLLGIAGMCGLLVSLLSVVPQTSSAQTSSASNSIVPVVSIQATDPIASVAGDTGTFTVFRAGDTNATLNVYCRIGGTASNGVDYVQISNFISIPAGARTNSVTIAPINHGQTNTETVVLQLAPSPLMTPINYIIGYPTSAVVYIEGNGVTNLPPLVNITTPADGSVFYTPVSIPIVAVASDLDGVVSSVEFFAGSNSLGVVTNWVVVDPPGPPNGFIPGTRAFFLTWINVPPGKYALIAKATDNGGATSTSEPVNISVRPPPPLPVVTVVATDPNASEPGVLTVINPGVFTIYRDAGTNNPLPVFYSLSGTASNGVDYVALSNLVVIPPGSFSADVVVNPLPDKLVEGT